MVQILLKVSREAGLGNYFKYQKANFLNILFKYSPPLQIFFSSPLPQILLSFWESDPVSPSQMPPRHRFDDQTTTRRTVTRTEGCQQLNNQQLLFLLVGVAKGLPSLENSTLPGMM